MFGLSFSEVLVIAVVALIVIGPERLPKTARTIGLLVGRAQRYVNDIKTDIEREMHVEDIKKFKDEVTSSVSEVKTSVESSVSSIADPLKKVANPLDSLKSQVAETEKQLKSSLNPLPDLKELEAEAKADDSVATAEATTDTVKVEPLESTEPQAVQQVVEDPVQELQEAPTQAESDMLLNVAESEEAQEEEKPAQLSEDELRELQRQPIAPFSAAPSGAYVPPMMRANDAVAVDKSVASSADVVRHNESGVEVASAPTQSSAAEPSGLYDGPIFEPLEEPVLSAEEQEARDQAWSETLAQAEDPIIDADHSLDGLSKWEQMPDEPSVATNQVKNTSSSHSGDSNV